MLPGLVNLAIGSCLIVADASSFSDAGVKRRGRNSLPGKVTIELIDRQELRLAFETLEAAGTEPPRPLESSRKMLAHKPIVELALIHLGIQPRDMNQRLGSHARG